jgi:RNA polymerase sigma factor (sigma-70 family)
MCQMRYESFEEMIVSFSSELDHYCKRLAGSEWDGEDLYQVVVIKAFRRYQRWPERELSKPYLFRIAVNAWIDICRRERLRIHPELLTEANKATYSEWSKFDVREVLEWAMDALEPRQVALILLIDVFGFTPKETGDVLGQPITAVKSALYRARQRLKKASELQPIELFEEKMASSENKAEVNNQIFEEFVMAFQQADAETLIRCYQNLKVSGVTVDRMILVNDKIYFYFMDPDGNTLMLTSRTKTIEQLRRGI